MFAGIFALERIRAQLSEKCTFKSVWDSFKTLCKSDRASNRAACAQVFTQTRRLEYAVIYAGFGILQTPENQVKFTTGTGICTFGGSENVEGKKPKIGVTQTHFIRNEIQRLCISALTEITMTRNASDPFGRQSRVSQVSNQRLELCRSLLPGDSKPSQGKSPNQEGGCWNWLLKGHLGGTPRILVSQRASLP